MGGVGVDLLVRIFSEGFTHLNEENSLAETAKTKDFKFMSNVRDPQNVQIMQPFRFGLQNLCVSSSHASNQVRLGISLGCVEIESFYGRRNL